METKNKMEHYERVKEEFIGINELFEEFLDYFHLTWINGKYFGISDWNYSKPIIDGDDIGFSKNFHITNNAVESCNAILNSCLSRGKT